MKRWTNGYGETVIQLEVGDKVVYSGIADSPFLTTITAILPAMPGYYRLDGVTQAVWKEQIRPVEE